MASCYAPPVSIAIDEGGRMIPAIHNKTTLPVLGLATAAPRVRVREIKGARARTIAAAGTLPTFKSYQHFAARAAKVGPVTIG